MSTTVARLNAVLSAKTDDFDRSMDRSEKRMGSFAKGAGLAFGAAGVAGALKLASAGFDEFFEAQKVTAQTDAVLKSTANAAHTTTKEIASLANALMRKSGVDDEAIQSGENMLLTFTNIRNEAGRGNDVFNQTTKTMLDMSVALGQDTKQSAMQLGKALNDPIAGIGALSRVGVKFTEDQRGAIKAMVDAGDTMGAQKVILAELGKEFGGSAEAAGKTFGGQINIAKQTLLNLAGEGVGKAMPALQSIATWIGEVALPKLKTFIGALSGNEGVTGAFSVVSTAVTGFFLPVIKGIATVFTDVFKAVGRVLDDHQEQVATLVTGVKATLKGIATVFTEVIVPTLQFVFKKGGPFDLAFGLAIDIIAGTVTAVEKIVGAVKTAVEGVRGFWNGAGGKAFRTVFDGMAAAIEPVVNAFGDVIDAIKWLIDHIPHIPKLPDIHMPGRGDASDPSFVPAGLSQGNLMGALPIMQPFADSAAAFGLQTTSGLRPGAITANGTPSDHGFGKALDEAGPASAMAAFFLSLIGNPRVKQAFYDPLGSIFGGVLSSYREGGHSDHVHVATYDKGGFLRPGWNLAYNGLGRPEPVGGGNVTIPVSIGGEHLVTVVWDQLRQRAQIFERRNGRPAF